MFVGEVNEMDTNVNYLNIRHNMIHLVQQFMCQSRKCLNAVNCLFFQVKARKLCPFQLKNLKFCCYSFKNPGPDIHYYVSVHGTVHT